MPDRRSAAEHCAFCTYGPADEHDDEGTPACSDCAPGLDDTTWPGPNVIRTRRAARQARAHRTR